MMKQIFIFLMTSTSVVALADDAKITEIYQGIGANSQQVCEVQFIKSPEGALLDIQGYGYGEESTTTAGAAVSGAPDGNTGKVDFSGFRSEGQNPRISVRPFIFGQGFRYTESGGIPAVLSSKAQFDVTTSNGVPTDVVFKGKIATLGIPLATGKASCHQLRRVK